MLVWMFTHYIIIKDVHPVIYWWQRSTKLQIKNIWQHSGEKEAGMLCSGKQSSIQLLKVAFRLSEGKIWIPTQADTQRPCPALSGFVQRLLGAHSWSPLKFWWVTPQAHGSIYRHIHFEISDGAGHRPGSAAARPERIRLAQVTLTKRLLTQACPTAMFMSLYDYACNMKLRRLTARQHAKLSVSLLLTYGFQ